MGTEDAIAGLLALFKADVDPESVACVVLEPVQGEGGFVPMPADFPARLKEVCEAHGILYVDDEVQAGVGRTGPVWAIEHYGIEPDLLVSGKSLGGGLPLAARDRPRRRSWTPSAPAGSAARSAATRWPARRRRSCSTRSRRPASASGPRSSGRTIRGRLEAHRRVVRATCAGSARCWRSSWCPTPSRASRRPSGPPRGRRGARARPAPALLRALRQRIRLLPPLTIDAAELDEGSTSSRPRCRPRSERHVNGA